MASIFTKIINGEIPSYRVAEDDRHFAFLDIRPRTKGHTLVVPKGEVDYYFDLSDVELAALSTFSKRVALAIKKAFPCYRVAQLIIGDEVPHAHIHLVPFDAAAELNGTLNPVPSPEEMAAIASAIERHFQ